jgi:hypothetical protein
MLAITTIVGAQLVHLPCEPGVVASGPFYVVEKWSQILIQVEANSHFV